MTFPRLHLISPIILMLVLLSAGGCTPPDKNDSSQGGPTGSGAQKSGGQNGGSGGNGTQLTEPAASTTGQGTGQAAVESDDGTPRAVSKTPNAVPGTPNATSTGKQQDRKLNSPENPTGPPASPQ